ncbi:MAG: Crp/Fnr family transcriptional regulator [Solirubrobacteraceae bacterium]
MASRLKMWTRRRRSSINSSPTSTRPTNPPRRPSSVWHRPRPGSGDVRHGPASPRARCAAERSALCAREQVEPLRPRRSAGQATRSSVAEEARQVGSGEFFGEMSLIDRYTRSATAKAVTHVRCLVFSCSVFRPFAHNHREVAWTLLELVFARVREAEARTAA